MESNKMEKPKKEKNQEYKRNGNGPRKEEMKR